ncbi:hypothetical protein ACFWBX_03220 [Streptomyces sp. NPDC059991]|uniref:hypothetical protein n=1 Tax=Streptomyces sp. NPDC059991 TaxID=3347028 RepID=UPI00368054F1
MSENQHAADGLLVSVEDIGLGDDGLPGDGCRGYCRLVHAEVDAGAGRCTAQ